MLEVAIWRQSYPINVVSLEDVGVVVVDVAVQQHKDNRQSSLPHLAVELREVGHGVEVGVGVGDGGEGTLFLYMNMLPSWMT